MEIQNLIVASLIITSLSLLLEIVFKGLIEGYENHYRGSVSLLHIPVYLSGYLIFAPTLDPLRVHPSWIAYLTIMVICYAWNYCWIHIYDHYNLKLWNYQYDHDTYNYYYRNGVHSMFHVKHKMELAFSPIWYGYSIIIWHVHQILSVSDLTYLCAKLTYIH
jgi:hypothetical protein